VIKNKAGSLPAGQEKEPGQCHDIDKSENQLLYVVVWRVEGRSGLYRYQAIAKDETSELGKITRSCLGQSKRDQIVDLSNYRSLFRV